MASLAGTSRGQGHPTKEWDFVPLPSNQRPTPRDRDPRLTVATTWSSLAEKQYRASKGIRASRSHGDMRSSATNNKRSRPVVLYDKNRPLPPLPLDIQKEKQTSARQEPTLQDVLVPTDLEVQEDTPASTTSIEFFAQEAISTEQQMENGTSQKPMKLMVGSELQEPIRIQLNPPCSPFTPTVVLAAGGWPRRRTIRKSASFNDASKLMDHSEFGLGLDFGEESFNNEDDQRFHRKWDEAGAAQEIQIKLEIRGEDHILTPIIQAASPIEEISPDSQVGRETMWFFPPPPSPPPNFPPPSPPIRSSHLSPQMLQLPLPSHALPSLRSKSPSTSSSRSTMSFFSGNTSECNMENSQDHDAGESEITDYEDYQNEHFSDGEKRNDEDDCDDDASTCRSSICSKSSAVGSMCSGDESGCTSQGTEVRHSHDESAFQLECVDSAPPVPPMAPISVPPTTTPPSAIFSPVFDDSRSSAAVLGISGPSPCPPSSYRAPNTRRKSRRYKPSRPAPTPGLDIGRVITSPIVASPAVGDDSSRVGSWNLLYPLGTKGAMTRSRAPSTTEIEDRSRLQVVVSEPVRPSTAPEQETRVIHTHINLPLVRAARRNEDRNLDLNLGKIKGFFSKHLNKPQLTEVERSRKSSERDRKLGIQKLRRNVAHVKDGVGAAVKYRRESKLDEVPTPPPAMVVEVDHYWAVERI